MRLNDRLKRLERAAPAAAALVLPLATRRDALAQLAAWQLAQQAAGAELPPELPGFCRRRLGLEREG